MHKKYGFTLIELLTVVVIIGILTSVAMPQYRKAIRRSEAASALTNLRAVFDAAKQHYAQTSNWPASLQGLEVEFEEATTHGYIGKFQYSFVQNAAGAACAADGSTCSISACPGANSYCLTAYYKKNNMRDVYTCHVLAAKYQSVCTSLCPDSSNAECEIK